MKRKLCFLAALLLAEPLFSQPIVHQDNTVTFNYRNDSAKQVSVDVLFAGEHPMVKAADGTWTLTLGPAAPDLYSFAYIVDGMKVMDPYSPGYCPNETFKSSLLDVNGGGVPMIHDLRAVPHGSVDYVNYWSESIGTWGNAIVYTPPFYDKNPQKKYPVMYLISGTTDTEEVYFKVGKINTILDNLIAEGQAKEMIVVLPYGNPSKYFPAGTDLRAKGDMFSADLINDLMPYVEKNYRTINDRDHRAIGGFSRGGNQGLMNGLTNLDKFSWLCSYSSYTSMDLPAYDRKDFNDIVHLFWLGVGNDDFLYGNAKEYMEFLDSKHITNTKVFTEGKFGHTWMNARFFLDRTLRLLFQDDSVVKERLAAGTSAAPKKLSKGADEQRLTPSVMAKLFPRQVDSPVFNADGSVTFSINAPEASKVELDSPLAKDNKSLKNDGQGVWSITVMPEKADLYPYAFVVDGTRVADPANLLIAADRYFKYSLADVPRKTPSLIDIQKVPHGKMTYRWCHVGDKEEELLVYTPAGYDPQGNEKLPVLYLRPGEADTYESWFRTGRANVILDNMIASGQAERMIAVLCASSDEAIKSFIDSEYLTLTGPEDSYAFAPAYGRSWMETRSSFEDLLPDLFRDNGTSLPSNISQNGYPKLMADNSIVFRFKASEDARPEIDLCGKRYAMTRGADGWWTVRTDPQLPGFHFYTLVTSGIVTADPASVTYYGGNAHITSAVDIPEEGCDVFETQDVPHGQVRELRYFSQLTGTWRPVFVYTPASYEKGKKKYPVVYIHHGGGEEHHGWIEQGRVANIMDNLIAEGKAEEMIVVSVNSNVPAAAGSRGGYSWEGMQPYRTELIDNIIPFVESTFRVKQDRHSRAMCGLSMGGGQSWYVGLRSVDVFANVGLFSSGLFGGIQAADFELERECPGILTDTAKFNQLHDTFFISCGEHDPRITYTRQVVDKMNAAGVKVTFSSYPGDHEWQVWRKSFAEYAQMLFK